MAEEGLIQELISTGMRHAACGDDPWQKKPSPPCDTAARLDKETREQGSRPWRADPSRV